MRDDGLRETARSGIIRAFSPRGGGPGQTLVESLRAWGGKDRFPDKLLRPDESAKTCGLTSTFQTAGCGPARPVVWEGFGGTLAAAPIPIFKNFRKPPRVFVLWS